MLTTTDALAQSHGVKVLVYGKPGTFKTRTIATAPAPVMISAESGVLSLREYKIPVWPINNLLDLQQAYAWATSSTEARQYQTLCIDSISEIAEVVLTAEKKKTRDGRKAYGDATDIMMDVIRGFRDMPGKHVYVTAKEAYDKDEQSGLMYFMPSMPGKALTKDLPYMFDEVFNSYVVTDDKGQKIPQWRTSADHQTIAKDRSGKLNTIEPAHIGYVFGKILG